MSALTTTTSNALQALDGNSVYEGIKTKLQKLKTENEHFKNENDSLRRELDAVRSNAASREKQIAARVEAECETKRQSLEKSVKKHLACIQTLLNDKEDLTKRLETMSRECTKLKEAHDSDKKKFEKAQASALSELQAKWQASEKQKREAWATKEAKKIKESTVKAMEPDIALMLNRHKAEKRRMEEEHAEGHRGRSTRAHPAGCVPTGAPMNKLKRGGDAAESA